MSNTQGDHVVEGGTDAAARLRLLTTEIARLNEALEVARADVADCKRRLPDGARGFWYAEVEHAERETERARADTRRIVMHLTADLIICDHVGDVGNKFIDLWAALGMGEPPDDGEGFDWLAIDELLGCDTELHSDDFAALASKVREP